MLNMIEVYHSYATREAIDLQKSIIDLFCQMASHLKIDFAPFIPII